MSARHLFFGIYLLEFCYEMFRLWITEKQRKKTLPVEVSDIYDSDRYQTYLLYTKDNRKLFLIQRFVSLLIYILTIFTPFYRILEKFSNKNIYILLFITFLINNIVDYFIAYLFSYIDTFKIEDKYGLNKKDKKEFNRSFIFDTIPSICMSIILYVILVYICEHMALWTNHFNISLLQALTITSIISIVFIAFIFLASVTSLIILKKQYTFTSMEDGALKDKINQLQSSSKKKVKAIYVYDESKKSTQKNAFLLRFLWIREFGIADNFLNDNSENELLAVLSHEIGHLKHKKTIWNYISYLFFVFIFLGIVYLISHGSIILNLTHWVNQSFGLTINNYYLLFAFYLNLFKPFDALISVYASNITRLEEYEADREAVKNGYGQELVTTFKRLSSDELINVNPSPIIEFLEYDHPGMYRRIKAIQDYERMISQNKLIVTSSIV